MDDLDDLEVILRCPFCDSVGVLEEVKSVTWRHGRSVPVIKYVAQCIIPSCAGHHGKAYIDKQTAIDKWNIRNGRLKEKLTEEDERFDELRGLITSAIESSRK